MAIQSTKKNKRLRDYHFKRRTKPAPLRALEECHSRNDLGPLSKQPCVYAREMKNGIIRAFAPEAGQLPKKSRTLSLGLLGLIDRATGKTLNPLPAKIRGDCLVANVKPRSSLLAYLLSFPLRE